MAATITVEGKQFGTKKRLFPDRLIPYPPQWQSPGGHTILRDLIERIVRESVVNFRQRQDERHLIRVLTAKQISAGVEGGKVDPGGRDPDQTVDEDIAAAAALQAFEDGLYYVFIDGVQQTELNSTIYITSDSTVTFIRLVLLAGG